MMPHRVPLFQSCKDETRANVLLKKAHPLRCASNLPGSSPGRRARRISIYASLLMFLRALHLSIPYPVREKLLNSLTSRCFQNTADAFGQSSLQALRYGAGPPKI
jgi:hypothetical protein